MVGFLSEMLDVKAGDFTIDERNLISLAFKNLVSGKRAAYRTITAIELNPKYTKFGDALAKYKAEIEVQVIADCERVIKIVNEKVLAKPCEDELRAFFLKMVGDYNRYIGEYATGAKLDDVKNKALDAYRQANEVELPPCHPIKLGLALNLSVFYYEVMKDPKEA